MTASFEKAGGKMIISEAFQVGDKDFKTQLTKIRSANPEAIYIPNYTAEMAQILEQASQLGIKIPFVSCDGFSNPDIYNLAGDFTHGVVYVGPAQVAESQAYSKFKSDYEKKFGVSPDSFATSAFDGANILLAAMEKVYKATGKFDRKAIRMRLPQRRIIRELPERSTSPRMATWLRIRDCTGSTARLPSISEPSRWLTEC